MRIFYTYKILSMPSHEEGRAIMPARGRGQAITPILMDAPPAPCTCGALVTRHRSRSRRKWRRGEINEGEKKKLKVDYTMRYEILWFRYGHYGYGCVTWGQCMDRDLLLQKGFYGYMIVQLRANALSASTKHNGCWIITKPHMALPLA